MIRTKVYSSIEADFALKYIDNRVDSTRILMAKPDFFSQSFIQKTEFEEKIIKSNPIIIQEQWEELNAIYHWLKDKNLINEIHELEAIEGLDSLTLVADKVISWKTEESDFYFLGEAKNEIEKRQLENISHFFTKLGYNQIDYEKEAQFSGTLDLIPHLGKKLMLTGIWPDQEIPCYKYITHIFQTPIITLELIDSKFKHLSECFLQIDEKNAMYYSDAFSKESIDYLHSIYDHIIDLPEDEVNNFALMSDLFSNENEKIALIQEGNSLSSKILKKFDYKIIDINLSEFNKFGIGIKHLRNFLF